ncbi:MAG: FKBP-type peptidyl-prolyl cis-trans isomerase [bacterium]
MKRMGIALLAMMAWAGLVRAEDDPHATPAASAPPAAPAPAPNPATASWTPKQRLGYALGRNVGESVKPAGADIDIDFLVRGLTEVLSGKDSVMNADENRQVMMDFQKQMIEKRQAAMKAEGEKNAAEGKKFLDENKKKDGVKVTASGLQYKVLKSGDGKSPKPTDTVSAHYKGTLINGTEFDSSYKRNEPAKFPVTGVIKGWTEALQMMKVGDKWQLVIPPELAYGPNGRPPTIPPQSTLVFEVELVGIQEAAPPPPPPAAKDPKEGK